MGKHEGGIEMAAFVYEQRGAVQGKVLRMEGLAFHLHESVLERLSVGRGGKPEFGPGQQGSGFIRSVSDEDKEREDGAGPYQHA